MPSIFRGTARTRGAASGVGFGQVVAAFFPDITFSPSLEITAARVSKLGLDIRSFREPLTRAIQQVMAPSFRENFESEGRPDSWPPLSEATYQIDENLGRPRRGILISTGLLMRTVQQLNIWTITKETAAILGLPEKIWYGRLQQSGTITIPARPFLVMQPEDMDSVQEIFSEWLGERIHRDLLSEWR